ncbi:MAG: coproporphyrinogen dehydrogenase HemZ [Oscillospiraceae bacterium]|nr:coproporphyrinogen dehydrogenase HemZ [Oscillospiraceae bacterium]
MTVYFENNSYKYEIEAVIRLFFPFEKHDFVFDGDFSPKDGEDYVLAAVRSECLFVKASVGGKNADKKLLPVNMRYDAELELCRMVFTCLSEITELTPSWGCLTGIRPVKKVNELIAQGLNKAEIQKHLGEKYYVSEEKSRLAYITAQTQSKALRELSDKSYSLYVAIPFCPSRCSYCSFVSHSIQSHGAKKLVPQYVDMLCREIEETGKILSEQDICCDSVYIGGGTPTALSTKELERIMKTIEKSIDISKIREYTVEAGRADTITEDKLIAIRDNGCRRISVNPQSMNDGVLAAIGRNHTAAQVEECYSLARRVGFDCINMDTIVGLPTDTPESFGETLTRIMTLAPENITVHTLTVKRSSRLYDAQRNHRGVYLADDVLSQMVSAAFETLTAAEYYPYYLYRQKNTVGNLENVGYSKAGKEGLYNIYIMEDAQNIIALGAGASTKLVDRSTGKIKRYFNYKYPYEYISRYEEMTKYKNELFRK